MQCCIEILEEQPSCTLDLFETETESECFQESDYVDSDIYNNEEDKQMTSPSKVAFIIYWTCLIVFAKKMFTFYLPDAGYDKKPPFRKISIDREIKMPRRP